MQNLQKEIINYLFLQLSEIKNQEKSSMLEGVYDDGEKFAYPVFAGQIVINKSTSFKAIYLELDSDKYLLFRMNDMPIFCIFGAKENQKFWYLDQTWKNLSLLWMSKVLTGVEMMKNFGLVWEELPKSDLEILINKIKDLLKNVE